VRVFRWAAIVMTIVVAVVTVYEAAVGELGRVLIGLAISIFGIFAIALTGGEAHE
jgi:hypothetical protein